MGCTAGDNHGCYHESMKKVLCVGSATIDILVRSTDLRVMKSHQVPGGVAIAEVYGGKTEAEEMVMETGGSGTNVAVGLARLGFAATTLAAMGDDWMKERIIANLKLEGVDTSFIQVLNEAETAMSVVLVAADGGRSILTHRGASAKIDSNKIDWEKVATADWLQIGPLGGNMALADDLVRFASTKKIPIGWNPGKTELAERERMLRLLPKVDLFILNRMEASLFLRHPYEEMKELGRKLLALGGKRTVVTDGKRGAGVAEEGRWFIAGAFKTKSVDDTGAGDAFISGMVAGILAGKDLVVALKMGLANGASEVTALGAKSGLLRKREMAKWLRRRLRIIEEKI